MARSLSKKIDDCTSVNQIALYLDKYTQTKKEFTTKKLLKVGATQAYRYIADVRRWAKEQGKPLISNERRVQTAYFIEFFGIKENKNDTQLHTCAGGGQAARIARTNYQGQQGGRQKLRGNV